MAKKADNMSSDIGEQTSEDILKIHESLQNMYQLISSLNLNDVNENIKQQNESLIEIKQNTKTTEKNIKEIDKSLKDSTSILKNNYQSSLNLLETQEGTVELLESEIGEIKSILKEQYKENKQDLKKYQKEQKKSFKDLITRVSGVEDAVYDSASGKSTSGGSGSPLKNIVGNLLSTLAGSASAFAPLLAKISIPAMGIMAGAAAGYYVGKLINENWIKPLWDEQIKKDKETFSAMSTAAQKTVATPLTNKEGESMYMVGQGKDREIMSKSELLKAIESTKDDKEKEKYQTALKSGPLSQIVDTETGIIQNQGFRKGETTDQFKERLTAMKQAEKGDAAGVSFNKFADQAAILEKRVRDALPKMEEMTKEQADGMSMSYASDAITLYHRVDKNKDMSNEQKEKIYKISPLVKYLGSNYEKVSDMTGAWDSGGGAYNELRRGIGVTNKFNKETEKYELEEGSQDFKDRYEAVQKRSDLSKKPAPETNAKESAPKAPDIKPSTPEAASAPPPVPSATTPTTAAVVPEQKQSTTTNTESYAKPYTRKLDPFTEEVLYFDDTYNDGYDGPTTRAGSGVEGESPGITNVEKGGQKSTSDTTIPKAASEGIIEGSKSGSMVTLGENYTSEAVVSTKPNEITKNIAANIVKEMSSPSNITSTERMSLLLQDGLTNSKNEYFDMTKAQPLASQTSGGTNIINNVIGSTGNSSEPNTQYNPAMIQQLNQTETLVQQCLYDFNKAALL